MWLTMMELLIRYSLLPAAVLAFDGAGDTVSGARLRRDISVLRDM